MAYYTSGVVGPRNATLENFESSPGAAMDAAIDEAFIGNPTNVLSDVLALERQDRATFEETEAPGMAETEGGAAVGFRRPGGARRITAVPIPQEAKLTQSEAQDYFKQAGVKLAAPESGISRPAADTLIERKREEMIRQDTLNRAPGGVLQGGARLGAGLAVSLLDPLNVASAFVPVVGPARYASMLERAGAGALARAGVRARVGAIEGAAGAAMLEPLVYAGRTQLQDDYDMTDSLINVAFGAALGGGLHVVGGRIADHIRGVGKDAPSRIAADEPVISPESIPDAPRPSFLRPEPVAPFSRLTDLTPERAQALALSDLEPEFRAQLLADAGNRAAPGEIVALRAQADTLRTDMGALGEQRYKELARQFQGEGLSRKQAESRARDAIKAQREEMQGRLDATEQRIEINRQASKAEQDIALLDRGEVPTRFAEQVRARAGQLQTQAAVQGAFPARHIAALAGPQARQDALRAAVAQAVQGKNVDVEGILRGSPEGVMDAARRQASPQSATGTDFQAAEAASARLKEAPTADIAGAQTKLDEAVARFDSLRQNLEQGGFDPARIARMTDELAAFDEAQAQAKSLGDAARAAAICGLRG